MRTRLWRDGALERTDLALDAVGQALADDTLVWIDLERPTAAELERLAGHLDLDPHAVEDALSHNERPKATRYPSHLFLTADPIRLVPGEDELQVGRVSAFCLRGVFVTVRLDDLVDIDSVQRRWDDHAELIPIGPKALLHGLLDEIVDRYFETVERLDDAVEDVEDLLFASAETNRDHGIPHRTFVLRRALVDARRAVLPLREVVNTVARPSREDPDTEALAPYFDDLYDHVLRVSDLTESLRDSITSIFDTTMSMSDARMNLIMKKLTSWAAIIAVPTAVTGYFGQNVPYPGFSQEWGFFLSLGLMLVIAVILYVTFRRKGWL